MKILYLCPDLGIPVLGRKGAAVHVRELVSAFGHAGHTVILGAQMLSKSPWEKPATLDVPIMQVRPASGTASAVLALREFNQQLGVENSLPGELRRILYNKELEAELQRRFENDPPDFIYERASLYATAGVSLARALRVPLILEVNAPLAVEQATYRATGFGTLAAEAERWTLTHADAVVVVSSQLGEHVRSLGAEASRVHVMPNGVNPELFFPGARDPELRSRLGLNGGPVIGFVGGLRPWHGVEVLPELMERLSAKFGNLHLVIAGDGPLRSQLVSELKRRNLSSRAVLAGLVPHEEVAGLIRQFDVAVAPYGKQDHTFYFSPLKLFEYMACGVPVVAPALGQIPEVIREGETGLLYPAGDLESLTARCEQLIGAADIRQRLGRAAADLVKSQFTWSRNAARVVELARSLPRK
jgi:glycosyltransferase involved in cell wall biosynthesis